MKRFTTKTLFGRKVCHLWKVTAEDTLNRRHAFKEFIDPSLTKIPSYKYQLDKFEENLNNMPGKSYAYPLSDSMGDLVAYKATVLTTHIKSFFKYAPVFSITTIFICIPVFEVKNICEFISYVFISAGFDTIKYYCYASKKDCESSPLDGVKFEENENDLKIAHRTAFLENLRQKEEDKLYESRNNKNIQWRKHM
jgi:hypothetical protein